MFSLPALEHSLVVYISTENFLKPFDLSGIPVITKEESNAQALHALTEMTPLPIVAVAEKLGVEPSVPVESSSQKYSKAITEIPEFKDFGSLLKSSMKPIELTEKETEYAVAAVKHIFQEHIVLQVPPLKPRLAHKLRLIRSLTLPTPSPTQSLRTCL
jgi:coatomer subunit gamma